MQAVVGAHERPLLAILCIVALVLLIACANLASPLVAGGPLLCLVLSLKQIALLLGYATFVLGVCLLACVVPARRALGVEPTIALRMD